MISELIPEYVEFMPSNEDMRGGIIYISNRFELCIHLCACGCGGQTLTPFLKDVRGWKVTDNDGKITLRPSIGNWSGERSYHAHYFITDGKVQMLK